MGELGFNDSDKQSMFKIIAAILHLGNVTFGDEPGAKQGQIKVGVTNGDGNEIL